MTLGPRPAAVRWLGPWGRALGGPGGALNPPPTPRNKPCETTGSLGPLQTGWAAPRARPARGGWQAGRGRMGGDAETHLRRRINDHVRRDSDAASGGRRPARLTRHPRRPGSSGRARPPAAPAGRAAPPPPHSRARIASSARPQRCRILTHSGRRRRRRRRPGRGPAGTPGPARRAGPSPPAMAAAPRSRRRGCGRGGRRGGRRRRRRDAGRLGWLQDPLVFCSRQCPRRLHLAEVHEQDRVRGLGPADVQQFPSD